jgi:T5SS/PEP-CTERM-associated repeat protein
MRTNRRLLQMWMVCTVALAGIFTSPTHAQYTGNYQTNIITSGVVSNWTGNYFIGWGFVFDALLIQNGGTLSNYYGFAGYTSSDTNNSILVSDSGSVWINGGDLTVGYLSSGNSMVISNGGVVVVNGLNGNVGSYLSTTASNNSVLVTGSGSVWTNKGALFVGDAGADNVLVIRDGGAVFNGGSAGYVGGGLGRRNKVVVTDTGSVWNNRNSLIIGYGRADNSLIIRRQQKSDRVELAIRVWLRDKGASGTPEGVPGKIAAEVAVSPIDGLHHWANLSPQEIDEHATAESTKPTRRRQGPHDATDSPRPTGHPQALYGRGEDPHRDGRHPRG